ncbi:unnamed protein product [Cuscuta epithymum]|uniref:HMA domain-containing protein n=1 Tax=Cuscuta epithymum TaxID=186058 RepID=A0AAV0D9I6_9ASTE|nr:unnamed protein product [Cuscuta epithymum]
MKGINSVCSSQAATAICLSMEGITGYGPSIQLGGGGGRAIDRFNPIITDSRRRTEADIHTSSRKGEKRGKKEEEKKHCSKPAGGGSGGWSCAQPGDFVTPSSSSSRYLLNDDEKYNSNSASSSSSFHPPASASTNKVVVVLRVSLHCRGCEKKMRKHISKMQGVSSFNIDFVAKKVTVVGDVTPLGVLASISKVKTAQLWPAG